MKIKILIISALSLVAMSSYAQDASTLYKVTFQTRGGNTARSVGMGGAFTSLGADPASLHINPAGLGMYRSSEVSITPSLYNTSVHTNSFFSPTDIISNRERDNSFRVNNLSAIFNLGKDMKGKLSGITIGVSYNSNFSNNRSRSIAQSSDVSILDYFGAQLSSVDNGMGAIPGDINSAINPNVYSQAAPNMWGSILAYNTLLLDDEKTGTDNYLYYTNTLTQGDLVNPSQWLNEKRSIDQLSFGIGMDFSRILYVGMSMGARMYENTTESIYEESYVDGNKGNFDALRFSQSNHLYGNAFDFKIGATVEPISGIRLGVAYHAPTVTFITDEIGASMSSYFIGESGFDASATPNNLAQYKVFSPSKFLAGVSARIGRFGILSVDYERTWSNKMELRGIDGASQINSMVKEMYRPTNNLYFGAEIQPITGFFLRGGYSIYESPYKKDYVTAVVDGVNVNNVLNNGFDYNSFSNNQNYLKTNEWSLGLGYRTESYYVDLTYQNSKYGNMPYRYFNESYYVQGEDAHVFSSTILNQEFRLSQVMLTVGFRF